MSGSVPPGRIAGGVARDLEGLHRVVADRVAYLGSGHLEQGPVARAAGRDHHMVDRCWQVLEEPLQGCRVAGVEGRGALRAEFQRRLLEPAGIAAGEDDIGTFGPGAPACLESAPPRTITS